MSIRPGLLVAFSLPLFASFSSSSTYVLKSYGLGSGATNNSSSSTYNLNGNLGERANSTSPSSATYTANTGSVNTGQLNSPPAPTLSNGSSSYYNRLLMVINNSADPSDSLYAVAISSDGFATTNYVSASGTIVGTPVYQSYTAWGGSSGTYITGLQYSTTYEVKAAAVEGQFSNTEYGAYASAATVSPSITFSVSPNSISMGSLIPNTVVSSSSISFGLSSNANAGSAIYVYGLNNGLYGSSESYTIPAVSTSLTSSSPGFGIQVSSVGQASGGPFISSSPYNGTGNTVGAESSIPKLMAYSTYPITSATASTVLKAITNANVPTGSDYSETLTFLSAANY
jgi:hypothetical protein